MDPRALRVLVVEDVRDQADTLSFLLQLWGYEALVAYDGPRALQVSEDHRPDVVLLDIGLPDMDGLEVARRLRQLPGMAQALLVAVTGYGSQALVERGRAAGIDRHFLKPMEPRELKQVLRRAELAGRLLAGSPPLAAAGSRAEPGAPVRGCFAVDSVLGRS
jgi:two-component system CheB/CheR fusion protein